MQRVEGPVRLVDVVQPAAARAHLDAPRGHLRAARLNHDHGHLVERLEVVVLAGVRVLRLRRRVDDELGVGHLLRAEDVARRFEVFDVVGRFA